LSNLVFNKSEFVANLTMAFPSYDDNGMLTEFERKCTTQQRSVNYVRRMCKITFITPFAIRWGAKVHNSSDKNVQSTILKDPNILDSNYCQPTKCYGKQSSISEAKEWIL